MHEVLVNPLGDLSLPRKSVVRLTDRPAMTLDVYRGRKTTMQQQHSYFDFVEGKGDNKRLCPINVIYAMSFVATALANTGPEWGYWGNKLCFCIHMLLAVLGKCLGFVYYTKIAMEEIHNRLTVQNEWLEIKTVSTVLIYKMWGLAYEKSKNLLFPGTVWPWLKMTNALH